MYNLTLYKHTLVVHTMPGKCWVAWGMSCCRETIQNREQCQLEYFKIYDGVTIDLSRLVVYWPYLNTCWQIKTKQDVTKPLAAKKTVLFDLTFTFIIFILYSNIITKWS